MGVRELDIRYKPLRLSMPVSGNVRNPCEAARLAAAVLADVTVEKVIALHVNTKHALIGVHVVSVGTLDGRRSFILVRCSRRRFWRMRHGLIWRITTRAAIRHPAPTIGRLCARLLQAGELLGVELLDALIVTDPSEGGAYYWFREAGALR